MLCCVKSYINMDNTMGRIIIIYIAFGNPIIIKLKASQVLYNSSEQTVTSCQCYMFTVDIVFMLMTSCMFLDTF